MRRWQRWATRRMPEDSGFTLVEVVVALVLLAMVSTTAAGLYIRATKDTAGLDRRQAAVGVAAQSMELARSIPPVRNATTGYSKLIGGRTSAAVDAQWAGAVTADLSQSDKEYDTAATTSSVPVLPMSSTTTVAGITYTARRLVGSCWRPPTGGDCVKSAVKATNSVFMYRVIIVVTWSEGGGATCSGGTCSYVLASLVDPTTDPSFNVNATNATWPAPPVLNPISTTISMNSSALVDLSTAVVTGATPFTATIGTPSQNAVASLLPNTTQVTVTPATGFWSGADITVSFTLADPYGQTASSTLSVHVNPPAAPTVSAGNATTSVSTPVSINLSSFVSGGTGTLAYSVGTPSSGSLSGLSGSTVTYTPTTGWYGSATFSFTVADAYGHSVSNTVTVTVPNPCGGVPTAVQDGTSSEPLRTIPKGSTRTVDVTANDTIPAGCGTTSITIVSPTSSISRGSASLVGGVVKFAAGNSTGSVTFTYKLTNTTGSSSTVTVYLQVVN